MLFNLISNSCFYAFFADTQMRKKFAFHLAVLIGANLLVKPIWIFGIDRVVQNKLGAAEYGTYFALFNYSLLFGMLLDLGLNNFNNRNISRSPARIHQYFGNLLMIKILLACMYFIATLGFAFFSGFSPVQFKILIWLLLNQSLLTLILFFRSNLQALQMFKTDSLVSVADRLLAIVFCSIMLLLYEQQFTIVNFAVAQTVALACTALFAGAVVSFHAGLVFEFWSRKFVWKIIQSSAPYATLVLLMSIYNRIDAVMLERLLPETGATQAGVYAAGYRIFDAANQFGFLFSALLLPMFAANFRKRINNKELFDFGSKMIGVFAVGISVFCFVWAEEIMQLLYHTNHASWVNVFRLIMLCFIPASLTYIAGTLATAHGSLIALCKISAVGMVFNIVCNFVLIKKMGAQGCAATALATSIIMLCLHWAVIHRKKIVPLSLSSIARLMLWAVLLMTLSMVVKKYFQTLPVQTALYAIAAFVLLLTLRVIEMSDLKKVIAIKSN